MKQKKMLAIVAAAVLSVSAGSGGLLAQNDRPKPVDPKQTFAHFDEAYIPALALTQQEKDAPAKAALRQLSQRWKQLRRSLAAALAADAKWPEELDAIEKAIGTATRQAQEGEFAEAHETLEAVRGVMMEARRRQNISYPLDSLSDFHAIMEEIVKPAMKYTPESMTDEEIRRLNDLCSLADEKWKVTEATEFDLALFGMEPSAATRLRECIEQERQAIADLHDALMGADKQKMIQSARGLKPAFAKTYMFFGDFPQPPEPAGK